MADHHDKRKGEGDMCCSVFRFKDGVVVLSVLIAGCFLLKGFPVFGGDARIGVLEKRGKGVQVIKAAGGAAAGEAIPLFAGYRIETPPAADCLVRYPDGALLRVYPNTSVMLARQIKGKGDDAQIEKEIHLSLGKVEFKAESGIPHQLRLISLTTAKAYRGDAVIFETDGIFTYVNQEEVMLGDLLEMPETLQAAEGEGKAAADQIGEAYKESIRSILK